MTGLNRFMPSAVEAVLNIYLSDEPRPAEVSQEEWLAFLLAEGLSDDDAIGANEFFFVRDIAETLCRCNRDLIVFLAVTHEERVLDNAIQAFWEAFSRMRSFMEGEGSPVRGIGSATVLFASMVEAVTRCLDQNASGKSLTPAERSQLSQKVRRLSAQLSATLVSLGFDETVRPSFRPIPEMNGSSPAVDRYANLAQMRAMLLLRLPEPSISVSDVLAFLETFPMPVRHKQDVLRVNQQGALIDILAFAVAEALQDVAFEDRVDSTFRLLVALAAGAESLPKQGRNALREGITSPTPAGGSEARRKAKLPQLEWPTRDRIEKRVREIDPRELWDFADAEGRFRKRPH